MQSSFNFNILETNNPISFCTCILTCILLKQFYNLFNHHLLVIDGYGDGVSLYGRGRDQSASVTVGMDPIHVRDRDWCFKGNRTVRQKMRSKSGRTNLFFHHRERSIHERLIRFVNCSFRAENFRKVQMVFRPLPQQNFVSFCCGRGLNTICSFLKFIADCFFQLQKGIKHHLYFSEIYSILFLFAIGGG